MHPRTKPEDVREATRPANSDVSEALIIVPRRRVGRWILALAVLTAVVYVVYSFAASPNINWPVVRHYLTARTIIQGARYTILLTLATQAAGIIGGIILASMRLSKNVVFQSISSAYIWFFRGTPLLIQIIFWYNIAIVFPRVRLGIPFTGIQWSESTNTLVTATLAAFLALGLNEAAYMAEIVRGGIISVDRGQTEAAQSIGMRPLQAFMFIILPQTIRVILPATGNQFIGMLKSTSLVSIIAAPDLMTNAQNIYSQNYLTVELLIVAALWYLVMTTVATLIQSRIERRYNVSLVGRNRQSRLARAVTARLNRQNS
ncbi:MAG TPA: amino acid ABC transporter permease [Acidothermaceae bacterium]|jgi:polar amino acid transport system permease protein|nr:amino acid ABC transporter permease [Acidothermaceae bacterium]